jgi:chromosome segregation ATPase
MAESLARKPMGRTIATRKSLGKQPLNTVPESDISPNSTGAVAHFSMSPAMNYGAYQTESENIPPDDEIMYEPEQLKMTDNAIDIRSRMEAELIALRRAQSVFADTHPSVDVQGKLQDLQEMYIGDLLVKDCQISQLKSQIETLVAERSVRSNISTPTTSASVPPPHTSMLAARVQSLQRSVAQERQRRLETEARLEDMLRMQESSIDSKAQLNKLTTNHRIEVHQLKSRLSQLQEANKRLQERVFNDGERNRSKASNSQPPSGEQSPVTTVTGAASPASSTVGGTERVPYVKYASLRAEKRQVEARLNAQIEQLQGEIDRIKSEREGEIDKLKEHHRRVVADLERKTRLAEQTKVDEGRELRDLRKVLDDLSLEKDRADNRGLEFQIKIDQLEQDIRNKQEELNELRESEKFLSQELEERERVLAQYEIKGAVDIDKMKEERLDLLEKIEEREDMLKSLQDESSVNRKKIHELERKLEEKQKEIATMISQADELDNLLRRADQDVSSGRLKIQSLSSEIESLRGGHQSDSARLSEIEKERDSLRTELSKLDSIMKATTVNSDQLKRGFELEIKKLNQEKDQLTRRIDSLLREQNVKDPALADAEAKIGQLEEELESMKREMERDNSYDSVDHQPGDTQISSLSVLQASLAEDSTENVSRAESLFHEAVDLCTAGDFSRAVEMLERSAETLAKLSKTEISKNDPETLKILESDIFGQLGVAFQSLSQVPEAIDAYTTAVDVDPEAHACHANLAVLLHHQSRIKEAETHAGVAVKLAPEIEEYQQLLNQIRGASSVTLSSSPTASPRRSLRHSTRW